MREVSDQEQKPPSSGLKKTRTRRKSRRSQAGKGWLAMYWLDGVLALGLLTAVLLILFSLTIVGEERFILSIAGVGLFLLVVVVGSGRLRRHINHHRAFWATRCSTCSGELKRMKRKPVDRLIGKMGIPVRRYICADCHWRGRKIDQTRL